MNRQNRCNLRPGNASGFVSCGLKYTSVYLHLLCPELRDMIFALSPFQTDGKTLALLFALRPDEELYAQALKVFYQVNELDMRWQSGLSWFAELRREVKGMVRHVAVAVSSTTSAVSILHTSLATLPNLTTLKLRSPATTLLTSFNLPSLLSPLTSTPSFQPAKLNWQHLTKLTIEAKLKTDKFPQGRGGIFLAAQRWADEYEAKEEVRRLKGEIWGLVGVEGEERFLEWPEILCVSWEAEKGKVLGDLGEVKKGGVVSEVIDKKGKGKENKGGNFMGV